jgi:hypothetical protein
MLDSHSSWVPTSSIGCKHDTKANMITLENDWMSFLPFFFSDEWILEQFFLQLVIINVYSCTCTWHVF